MGRFALFPKKIKMDTYHNLYICGVTIHSEESKDCSVGTRSQYAAFVYISRTRHSEMKNFGRHFMVL